MSKSREINAEYVDDLRQKAIDCESKYKEMLEKLRKVAPEIVRRHEELTGLELGNREHVRKLEEFLDSWKAEVDRN